MVQLSSILTTMFKVKAYHFHPINVICVTLLVTILFFILTGYNATQPVSNPTPIETNYDLIKDYQLEITADGKHVIMWNGAIPVTALPLDNKCNLTRAIEWDNQ